MWLLGRGTMEVEIVYRLPTTTKGKVLVTERMSVKKARQKFKEFPDNVEWAYLRHFDGWHNQNHCWLKERKVNAKISDNPSK